MRACSWATVAWATAGPPHTRRSSAWTAPCGSPDWRAYSADEAVEQLPLLLQRPVQGRRRRGRGILLARSDAGLARACGGASGAPAAAGAVRARARARAGRGGPRNSSSSGVPGTASCPNSRPSKSTRSKWATRAERLVGELVGQGVRGGVAALGGGEQVVVERPLVVALRVAVERVVALALEFVRRAPSSGGHVRQEDARGLAPAAGAHEPADGLGEEQRRRGAGRVDADREARHVDALRHHPHRDHPAARALREGLDPRRGLGLVGEHDRRLLARDLAEDRRVRTRRGLVGRDDEPAGVGHLRAHLGEPPVGRRAARPGSTRPPGRGRCARPAR